MKNRFFFSAALIFLAPYFLAAQDGPGSMKRFALDSTLAPFYHGVASGDPLPDGVIIWTRITTEDTGDISVSWKVATDTLMSDVIQSGTVITNASKDHTVKADVTGLQAGTYYYYRFEEGGRYSLTGRTKTAPTGSVSNLRFAVVSCSNYPTGYFNAYSRITARNDVDAVLHLGDYLYEYGSSGGNRPVQPPNEIVTLADYRMRYSHYRLDEDLMRLHQQYPWIVVWDDHETANNSWSGGAENHTPGTEGDWNIRKANAAQAYYEWLPIRMPDMNDPGRIFRKLEYGNLATLHMLDTRIYGRTQQGAGAAGSRTILGTAQRNWLRTNLTTSTSQWNILGQQVVVGAIPFVGTGNTDSWDGYPADRDTLYDIVLTNNVDNLVVLTGDVHTAWASDLPTSSYNSGTQAGSAGVEFVCNSVTSTGLGFTVPLSVIQGLAPNVKFAELAKKGYLILDINSTRIQGDFYNVETIANPSTLETYVGGCFSNDGTRYLGTNSGASVFAGPYQPYAPFTITQPVGISNPYKDVVVVGIYPNPFNNQFTVQFYTTNTDGLDLTIHDMMGKEVLNYSLGNIQSGLNYETIDAQNLTNGFYLLSIKGDGVTYQRKIIKGN